VDFEMGAGINMSDNQRKEEDLVLHGNYIKSGPKFYVLGEL
jgi:hypothetical protein